MEYGKIFVKTLTVKKGRGKQILVSWTVEKAYKRFENSKPLKEDGFLFSWAGRRTATESSVLASIIADRFLTDCKGNDYLAGPETTLKLEGFGAESLAYAIPEAYKVLRDR